MFTALWILQGITSFIFFGVGIMKLLTPSEKLSKRLGDWVNNYSKTKIRVIGSFEILGSAGLIYPRLLDIYPMLTIVSAIGLLIIMLLAVQLHVKRNENILFPSILGLMNILIFAGITLTAS